MSQVPEDLKVVAPFLKRAQELEGREPVIAYFCRFYAVKLSMSKRTPANKAALHPFLMGLMQKLEEDKKKLQGNEAITDDNVGKEYVRNFALKIFIKADNEDRSGDASSKTARTFFIASTFLELLRTFGEIEPDVAEKIKYAKWKATDILKAEKEGRRPTAGPPGGENGFGLEGEGDGMGDGFGEDAGGGGGASAPNQFMQQPPPVASPQQGFQPYHPPANASGPVDSFTGMPITPTFAPTYPAPTTNFQPPPPNQFQQPPNQFQPPQNQFQQPPTQFQPPPNQFQQPPNQFQQPPQNQFDQPPAQPQLPPRSRPPAPVATPIMPVQFQQPLDDDDLETPRYDPVTISNAQKFARFAISALQYDDVATALENLAKSMSLLQNAQQQQQHHQAHAQRR